MDCRFVFVVTLALAYINLVFSLPSKIDLGLIVDTSEDMGEKDFNTARKLITRLLDNFSISPGTTRVAFYTVGNKMTEKFHFREHVNRECLLKSITDLKFKGEEKTYDFQQQIYQAIRKLKSHSRTIMDQKLFYLFFSNSFEEVTSFYNNYDVTSQFDGKFGLILISTSPLENVILNDENQNKSSFTDNFAREKIKQNIHVTKVKSSNNVNEILNKLNVTPHSYTSCHNADDEIVYDQCNRQCSCRNGTMTNCFRIRKEFTAMSRVEKRRYLRAYKKLTSISPYKEIYERFVFMHYKYFCWGIHNREYFLPWHRWFISEMEDLLKQIDCRVNLAYWDWSYVSDDPWNREKLWRSSDDGLGGNGNRYKGYCVQNGIFRESEWETPYWEDPMDIILSSADQLNGNITGQRGHLAFCLRRAFKGRTPTLKSVQRTVALPAKRFKDFDIQIRHNYHDRIHNIVGGTMCTHYAANTPEFWMHHAMLDKIWFLWQQKSKQHLNVHFLQRNTTKMMGTRYTQKELIDCKNLPRCIRVKYTKFPILVRDKRAYDDIDDMARTSHKYWDKYLNESWYGHFPDCSRSKKEKKRAKYLHKVLDAP